MDFSFNTIEEYLERLKLFKLYDACIKKKEKPKKGKSK